MNATQIQQVDPTTILRPAQVRTEFDEQAQAELRASIAAVGILQPILVRLDEGKMVVLDGERRIRAAIALDLTAVPVIVGEQGLDAVAVAQRQLIANTIREGLSPMEQAEAISAIMSAIQCTAADVARMIGKSPGTVSKLLSLLDLPPELRQQVAAGKIGLREGHELARSVRSGAEPGRRRQRLTAILDAERSVAMTGVEDSMEAFVGTLDDLLTRTKAARRQGVELPTFLAMLRDQAKL
ncbi:MAG TPA: ParB/RepB/Spo0J family partition protein [Bryobacteraceae bacterium]|jgi:ParB family chromosome partitioning protein